MSVADDAPVNSSSSDDFATLLDTELESTSNTYPEPEEDADETHCSDSNRCILKLFPSIIFCCILMLLWILSVTVSAQSFWCSIG